MSLDRCAYEYNQGLLPIWPHASLGTQRMCYMPDKAVLEHDVSCDRGRYEVRAVAQADVMFDKWHTCLLAEQRGSHIPLEKVHTNDECCENRPVVELSRDWRPTIGVHVQRVFAVARETNPANAFVHTRTFAFALRESNPRRAYISTDSSYVDYNIIRVNK